MIIYNLRIDQIYIQYNLWRMETFGLFQGPPVWPADHIFSLFLDNIKKNEAFGLILGLPVLPTEHIFHSFWTKFETALLSIIIILWFHLQTPTFCLNSIFLNNTFAPPPKRSQFFVNIQIVFIDF